MLLFENGGDILSFAIFFLFIILIIIISWLSTYVREPTPISTTFIVLQNSSETSSNRSSINTVLPDSHRQNLHQNNCERMNSETIECKPESQISNKAESSLDKNSSTYEQENQCKDTSDDHELTKDCECSNSDSLQKECSCNNSENFTPKEESETEGAVALSANDLPLTSEIPPTTEFENSPKQISNEIPSNHNESATPDSFKIRLVFLDESQKVVYGKPTEEVGDFKRSHFDAELSSNCTIRLIFNGQLLSQDSSTLGHYGLFDNCALHCIISQPNRRSSNINNNPLESEELDFDFSEFMSPLFLGLILIFWLIRYQYPFLFNSQATYILAVLTFLFLLLQYNFIISSLSNMFEFFYYRVSRFTSQTRNNVAIPSQEGNVSEESIPVNPEEPLARGPISSLLEDTDITRRPISSAAT